MKEFIKIDVDRNEETEKAHVKVTASDGMTVEQLMEILSKTLDGLMPLYESDPESKFRGGVKDD